MSTEASVAADEYFFATTLSQNDATMVWDPDSDAKEEMPYGHKLVVRSILLGAEAKDDEVNVVETEAIMYKDSIKIPIAVLNKKNVSNISTDIVFPDPPVTFKLKEGSGPVHIIGHHLIGSMCEEYEEVEDYDEEALEDEEEEVVNEDNDVKQKKNGKTKRAVEEDGNVEDEAAKKKVKLAAGSGQQNSAGTSNTKKPQPAGKPKKK